MRLLRQTYFAFLRKLLRLGPEAHVSNQTALVKTNTADVRIFLLWTVSDMRAKSFRSAQKLHRTVFTLNLQSAKTLGFMVYLRILCG